MDWLLWDKQDLQAKWTGCTGGELQRASAAETTSAVQAPASMGNLSKIVLGFFLKGRKQVEVLCLAIASDLDNGFNNIYIFYFI